MDTEDSYLEINRQSWNNRTDTHIKSEFYNVDRFLKGENSLNDIEMELLGDLSGKSVLHLQCHFGQDSISLSRFGARVTGIDLSDVAIERAKELAEKAGAKVEFICSDVYGLPEHLNEEFDIVFASYGTIGWLPDLDRWAKIVSKFLKPNGMFVFAEFHPVVWMFNNAFDKVAYRYFNSGPIIESSTGSYADKDGSVSQQYVMWNHGLGEVLSSLIKNGLEIRSMEEFDYSPYNCFSGTVEIAPNKYRIAHLEDKIPMVYALSARKRQTKE